MKDSHLREIARIRNENSVEIMRLKKVVAAQSGDGIQLGAKEHHAAYKAASKMQGTSFADNEVERQRRMLIEENGTLKKRLRAVENILKSGTSERTKFMEGASKQKCPELWPSKLSSRAATPAHPPKLR